MYCTYILIIYVNISTHNIFLPSYFPFSVYLLPHYYFIIYPVITLYSLYSTSYFTLPFLFHLFSYLSFPFFAYFVNFTTSLFPFYYPISRTSLLVNLHSYTCIPFFLFDNFPTPISFYFPYFYLPHTPPTPFTHRDFLLPFLLFYFPTPSPFPYSCLSYPLPTPVTSSLLTRFPLKPYTVSPSCTL